MMIRFSLVLLLRSLSVQGFVVQPRASFAVSGTHSSLTSLTAAGADDDWYSDYDPSAYQAPTYETPRYQDRGNAGNSGRGPPRPSRFQDRSGTSNTGRGSAPRKSFGGGDIGYTRDTSRDNSNVDVGAVENLIAQRTAARRSRDFEAADNIRDQLLKEYSVGVFDKDSTWRTGCSTSGSGMPGGNSMRGGRDSMRGGRDSMRGGRDSMRGGSDSRSSKRKDFGPNGHDYDECQDSGPNSSSLSEDQIHELLAQRLQAKMSRSFEVADRLQYELINAGVFVHDGRKEWRADGTPFGEISTSSNRRGPDKTRGSSSDRNRPYAQSKFSLEAADTFAIQALVDERVQCKQDRDFNTADSIREELMQNYNVAVDDRTREWSVGGNFGDEGNRQRDMSNTMKSRDYEEASTSAPFASEADAVYVRQRVSERSEAKGRRDFDLADEIRAELLEDYDVVIDDRSRQYSVGGDFGEEQRDGSRDGGYARRGGGNLTPEDVKAIAALIKERIGAKKDRDFDRADEIRDILRDTYNVKVDDKRKEWQVQTDDYAREKVEADARKLTDAQIETVQAKLLERSKAKKERNYDLADDIRDELRELYSVVVDDKTLTWKTLRGERDDQDEPDDFNETTMSSTTQISDDAGNLSREELAALTVPQLKDRLRDLGKPVGGVKSELVDRILS